VPLVTASAWKDERRKRDEKIRIEREMNGLLAGRGK
jgi:hypothetical protein